MLPDYNLMPAVRLGAQPAGAVISNLIIKLSVSFADGRNAFIADDSDGGADDVDFAVFLSLIRRAAYYDYGDAAASYGVARHTPDICNNALYIGNNRADTEFAATVDTTTDNTGGDVLTGDSYDEDGISTTNFQIGGTYNLPITLKNRAALDGYLNAWMDFDGDGTFEASEKLGAEITVASMSSSATLSFTVPLTAEIGVTKMRLRLCSGAGDCNTPTGTAFGGEVEDFTVNVAAATNAIADEENTDEDESVVVAVLDNDLNVQATGTLSIITAPVNGSVVITDPNSTPTNPNDDVVTYTPNANYNGTDTFEYKICDSAVPGNCSSAVATITIKAVADAIADEETTDEDESVVVTVLDNDLEVPATGSLSIITAPVNGSVVITDPSSTPTNPNDDVVTYTPNANYNGTDTFEYEICDSAVPANCSSAEATITVNAVADAIADEETTDEDESVVVAVLDNDLEVPATGSLTIIAQPDHGSVVITDPSSTPTNPNDDVVTYTPDANYNGTDTFEYEICDSAVPANCSSAEVTITVNAVADAIADEETTDEDESVVVAVLDNDLEVPATGSLTIIAQPDHGSVLITDPSSTPTNPNDDVVTYTPNADYNGTDTFEYEICDSAVPANCSSAEATITVNAVADAIADEETTDEDESVVVAVLDNDLEVPATGTLSIIAQPDHGSVVLTDPNSTPTNPNDDVVTYTPNANYNGTDTFEYEICDSAVPANCSSAEATITVNAVADAIADEETTDEDESVVVAVLDNDLEVPATGSLTIIAQPDHGSVVITDPNSTPTNPNDDVVTYTPNADYNGTDTFEYEICDSAVPANCSSAEATITVNAVADAIADAETTDEDESVVVAVLDNDLEVPATGSLTIIAQPDHGSVLITDPNSTPTNRMMMW